MSQKEEKAGSRVRQSWGIKLKPWNFYEVKCKMHLLDFLRFLILEQNSAVMATPAIAEILEMSAIAVVFANNTLGLLREPIFNCKLSPT